MKLLIGTILFLIGTAIVYSMYIAGEWYASQFGTLGLGCIISVSLMSVAIGLILICAHFENSSHR